MILIPSSAIMKTINHSKQENRQKTVLTFCIVNGIRPRKPDLNASCHKESLSKLFDIGENQCTSKCWLLRYRLKKKEIRLEISIFRQTERERSRIICY